MNQRRKNQVKYIEISKKDFNRMPMKKTSRVNRNPLKIVNV